MAAKSMHPEATLHLVPKPLEGAPVSHLYPKLKDLNAAVQKLALSPEISESDLALLEEAQHACDIGIEFVLNHRPVQARYAYAFAELCQAVVEGEVQSPRLRQLLEELME
jgi:hypothetical protein